MQKYKLINGEVVKCSDTVEWAKWFEDPKNRMICKIFIKPYTRVWTVFIGLGDDLFETIVYVRGSDQHHQLYKNIEDAKKGHNEIVIKLNSGISLK